jgi:hypothetical protein
MYDGGARKAYVTEMFTRSDFPHYEDAPACLLGLANNCGPLSVWMMLTYYRKRFRASLLPTLCKYSRKAGTFTIGLALALKSRGLAVSFKSSHDPAPTPAEKQLYALAKRRGIDLGREISLHDLRLAIEENRLPIVYFPTPEGNGHFSPLIGFRGRRVILPNTESGEMDVKKFERCWLMDGFYGQCVVCGSEQKRRGTRGTV